MAQILSKSQARGDARCLTTAALAGTFGLALWVLRKNRGKSRPVLEDVFVSPPRSELPLLCP